MSRDTVAAASFLREGEYWTVLFDGRVSRLRDSKGLRYLDVLVHRPGEEVPAVALVAAVEGHAPGPRPTDALGREGDAGPLLDRTAIAAYRQRMADLQEDLDEAEAAGDGERAARARLELEALADQLSTGVGLGGRARRAGSNTERARLAVTKAIRSALAKLEEADPQLGRHLDRTIRTGTSCAYLPDPRAAVQWDRGAVAEVAPPAVAVEVPGSALPPALPLVGRARETGVLHAVLDALAAGERGRVLLVTGEAGIGKSRLVQEVATEAAERGYSVLIGRCPQGPSGPTERGTQPPVPWSPVVEMVDAMARGCADDRLGELLGPEAPDLARLLPWLTARLPGLAPRSELPPAEARRFLERSAAEVLVRFAQSRPLLVVFEDLHWADPASVAVLERLVDRLGDAPFALVVTTRPDEPALDSPPAHAVEWLLRNPACVSLRLGPLAPDHVAELIAAVAGAPADPALVERLSAETGGNALFVVEMLKHLKEEGRLGSDASAGGDSDAGAALPASLRLVIGHRVQRLSPAARNVLTTAAVFGRDVAEGLLAVVHSGGEDELLDALDEAIAARLLVPSGDRVRFVHALVRQAVLAELTPMRRRRLHHTIADALLRLRTEDPDAAADIADHLDAGRADPAETAAFHQRAAQRALERFAYEDAATRLDRALVLAPADDKEWRARLLSDRGAARRSLGLVEEAMVDWSQAVDLLESQGPGGRRQAGALCVDVATTVDVIGRLDVAVSFARRGLALAGPDSTALRCRLLSALGYALALAGEHTEAAERLAEATGIAESIGDLSLMGRVLAARVSFDFVRACFPACLESGQAAFDALMATGDPWQGGQALLTSFIPCVWMGQFEVGLARAAKGMPVLRRVGHLAALCWDARVRYQIDLARTGDLDAFAAATEHDVEVCRANRLRWLADAQVLAGTCEFWRGDWDAAAAMFEAAAAMATPAAYVGRYTASLLWFTAWRGDAAGFDRQAEAHRRMLAGSAVAEQSLGRMAFTLAEVEGQAILGRREAAAALYPLVVDALDRQVLLRPMDLRMVEALAAVAAAAGGNWTAAERHLAGARHQVASFPQRREEPDLDFFEAMILLWRDLSGDRGNALNLLERAAKTYEARRMPRHATRAAEMRARAGAQAN